MLFGEAWKIAGENDLLAAKEPHMDKQEWTPEERKAARLGRFSEDIDFVKSVGLQGPDMTERQERRFLRAID